jgi:MFS family permease
LTDTTAAPDRNAQGSSEPWPKPSTAWYAMFVFILALFGDMLDRGIVNLLVPDMKRDLGLSDTKISLLLGLAFVLFYAVLGLPIARLVDSKSRRLVMGLGIATWSVMTAACGLAQNFWQLFAARVGVGVGEACNGPSTYSMMSDLFPRERLTRAASVLQIGFVLGTGLASIIGGAALAVVEGWPEISIPVIGVLRNWQLVFLLVGLPGLLIAAMMGTIPEPKRRGLIQAPGQAATKIKPIPVRDVVKFLGDNRKFYGPMYLGLAVNGLTLGAQAWIPTFFQRTYGMKMVDIAYTLGAVVMGSSLLGLVVGTKLAEWFLKRGYLDANLRLLMLALILALPVSIIYPLMPTPTLAFTFLGINMFIRFLSPGAQNAALQVVTPNEMRGQITAIFIFIFNLVGFGLGPIYIALMTDYLFGAESQLKYALATASAIACPIAIFILWRAMKPYAEMYTKAQERD